MGMGLFQHTMEPPGFDAPQTDFFSQPLKATIHSEAASPRICKLLHIDTSPAPEDNWPRCIQSGPLVSSIQVVRIL